MITPRRLDAVIAVAVAVWIGVILGPAKAGHYACHAIERALSAATVGEIERTAPTGPGQNGAWNAATHALAPDLSRRGSTDGALDSTPVVTPSVIRLSRIRGKAHLPRPPDPLHLHHIPLLI